MAGDFTKVGAAWVDREKGRVSIKLNNGMYITLFKVQEKKSDSSPDFTASMKTEEADQLGIEAYQPSGGSAQPKVSQNDLPF